MSVKNLMNEQRGSRVDGGVFEAGSFEIFDFGALAFESVDVVDEQGYD